MSATTREREDFIYRAAALGLPLDVARKVLRHAATLQRIAELQCSSEWHMNHDRVPCPASQVWKGTKGRRCLCEYDAETDQHGDVPRITVQADRVEDRATALLAPYGLRPEFQGDPRGAVVSVVKASVAHEDFYSGRERGLAVPA